MENTNSTQSGDKTSGIFRGKAESDALFLSIGDGVIVTDNRGSISRVNQAALDILGYEEKDVIGKWYPNAIQAEDESGKLIPNIDRSITQVFLTGKPVTGRVYFRKKDDTRIAVGLNVSPVLLDGHPIGAIEVFRDITQEVLLDKAKDEFISIASHQLRTPASGVKQYASMLLEGYAGKLTAAQKKMIKTIYDSNERQITIVNDLLRVAHVDAGQVQLNLETIDMVSLIADILNEQAHIFKERRQTIRFMHDEPQLTSAVDVKNMRMVIENIIDNASKYTPQHKNIHVTVLRTRSSIKIHVQDEGVGIPKKDLANIFKKFSRLENALSVEVGGTGLGLYWAKKIVKLHAGTIRVQSEVGSGSVFTISIPLRTSV